MRKVLCIATLSFITITAQDYKFGFTIDILTGNKYLDYQVGPALILEISPDQFPLSFRGSTRFYFGQLSKEISFRGGSTSTVIGVGVSVNYIPIDWDFEPYLETGIFYNSHEINY